MFELITEDQYNRGQVQIVVLVLLIALAVALVGFLGPTLIGFVGEVSENPDANADIDPQFETGNVDIIIRSVNDDTEAIEVTHEPREEIGGGNDPDTHRFEGDDVSSGSAELDFGNGELAGGDLIIVTAIGTSDESTVREYEVPENVEATG